MDPRATRCDRGPQSRGAGADRPRRRHLGRRAVARCADAGVIAAMTLAMDRWDQLAIAASLSANGFIRRSPWRHGGRSGHREWLHFTVHAGELTLVVNASFVDDLRPAAPPHRERVRLLVLARDARGWHGGVDDLADAVVRGGQLDAVLGEVAIAGAG